MVTETQWKYIGFWIVKNLLFLCITPLFFSIFSILRFYTGFISNSSWIKILKSSNIAKSGTIKLFIGKLNFQFLINNVLHLRDRVVSSQEKTKFLVFVLGLLLVFLLFFTTHSYHNPLWLVRIFRTESPFLPLVVFCLSSS